MGATIPKDITHTHMEFIIIQAGGEVLIAAAIVYRTSTGASTTNRSSLQSTVA
jgi:hypothetical protein